MRKIIYTAAAMLSMFFGCVRPSHAETVWNGELVNDSCIGASTNYDLNLQKTNATDLSFIAVYSTTTPAAKTFTDGRKSTATVTVENYSALIAAKANITIAVMSASTTTLRNTGVYLNGERFYASPGGEWTPVLTATGNATALAAAINASSNFDAVAVSTVVYATAAVTGAGANLWAVTTNSTNSFRLAGGNSAATTLSGGLDDARLAVNGVTFTQGAQFTAATSSAATASSICAALFANSTATITCSTSASSPGIVTYTAAAVGTGDYAMFTSTPAALKVNGSASVASTTMINGAEPVVSLANDLITVSFHGYGTGLDVLYSTAGTNTIGGLTNQTTYYVIKSNYDQFKLASSKANAALGTAIDLTSLPGGQTYTLTPLSRTGNPSFKWQVSNNSTYVDLAVSSVTITTSDSSFWNFGTLPYKTLRLKYAAPTTGCGAVTATGTGTR